MGICCWYTSSLSLILTLRPLFAFLSYAVLHALPDYVGVNVIIFMLIRLKRTNGRHRRLRIGRRQMCDTENEVWRGEEPVQDFEKDGGVDRSARVPC